MTLQLEWIKTCVTNQRYVYSAHADKERQADFLTLDEVEQAIVSGIIIESYEDTGRGPSCLIAGFTKTGKPIHIVAGRKADALVIITVYIPGPPKFINPFTHNRP